MAQMGLPSYDDALPYISRGCQHSKHSVLSQARCLFALILLVVVSHHLYASLFMLCLSRFAPLFRLHLFPLYPARVQKQSFRLAR